MKQGAEDNLMPVKLEIMYEHESPLYYVNVSNYDLKYEVSFEIEAIERSIDKCIELIEDDLFDMGYEASNLEEVRDAMYEVYKNFENE